MGPVLGMNVLQPVRRVESSMDALIWCEELAPQILVLDWYRMFEGLLPGDMKATTLLQKLKALKNAPAVIVASRLSLDDHRAAALGAGADGLISVGSNALPRVSRNSLIH